MRQVTLRLDDELARQLKDVANQMGRSVNAYAGLVLRAAVDPALAGDDAARLRERLDRAGLLASPSNAVVSRPSAAELESARKEAGRGRPLSELVSEGRG